MAVESLPSLLSFRSAVLCARNLLFPESTTNDVCKQQIPPLRSAHRRNDKNEEHLSKQYEVCRSKLDSLLEIFLLQKFTYDIGGITVLAINRVVELAHFLLADLPGQFV